jgi:hypothetical protein
MAQPGVEYIVYSKIGSATIFNVNLSAITGEYSARFYNPRTGQFLPAVEGTGGGTVQFTKPNSDDWALHIVEIPGVTADRDGDDDVDMDDFARFQLCFSGSGNEQIDSMCFWADFDDDGDVDGADFDSFQGCVSGANRAADLNCAN